MADSFLSDLQRYLRTLEDLFRGPSHDGLIRAEQNRIKAIKRSLGELGLKVSDPDRDLIYRAIAAQMEADGAVVTLTDPPNLPTRLVAEGLPLKMTLRQEQGLFISSPIQKRLGLFWKEKDPQGEVLIGDLAFDNVIAVRGNATLCRALLNAGLREAGTLVIGARNGVMDGRRLTMSGTGLYSGESIKEWAEPFVRMVKMMMGRAKRGTEACLAENAVAERIWEVRAFNLAELGRHFPGTPATLEASRTVLKRDTHPWCRTLAAANLGMEGAPVLKETLENRSLDADLCATALYHLGRILPSEKMEPVLIGYLESKEWPLPSAAIQALVEGAGTVKAVPALLELSENGWRRSVRHEAAGAAARIQARLEGAEAGQLSVVGTGGEEGRLSRPGDP